MVLTDAPPSVDNPVDHEHINGVPDVDSPGSASALTDAAIIKPEIFQPLTDASKEIRVVEINPAPKLTDPIHCSLQNVSLQDPPSYIAISYACGDPTKTRPIQLNGHIIQIYSNLYDALRRLRSSTGSSPLWIDALCINQADASEKATQVASMAHIYQKADTVLVWIGEESETSARAFKILGKLCLQSFKTPIDNLVASRGSKPNLKARVKATWLKFRLHRSLSNLCPTTQVAGINVDLLSYESLIGEKGLIAIKDLLLRSWWTRLWVHQEFLITDDTMMLCGKNWYSGKHIAVGLSNFLFNCRPTVEEMLALNNEETVLPERQLMQIKHLINTKSLSHTYPETKKNRRLLDLVVMFQDAKCSDPRDKIFALLGIAVDEVAKRNPPDYTLSTYQVYRRLIETSIEVDQRLDVLNLCDDSDAVPTWIPNFNSKYGGITYKFADSGTATVYTASGSSKPEAKIMGIVGLSSEVLEISGFILDSVKESNQFTDWGIKPEHVNFQPNDNIILHWQAMERQDMSMESFWIAMSLEITATAARMSFEQRNDFVKELRAWIDSGSNTWPNAAFEKTVNNASGRRFFTTDNGRFGFGPGFLEPGDLVCILFGGQSPFILRRCEDAGFGGSLERREYDLYKLVSAAYVFAHMDGEAMELYKQGKYPKRSFKLV